MTTDDLPVAEYDKPGWVFHAVLGVLILALATWQLVDPVKSGPGRWLIPLAWLVLAGYYAVRSRRLWRSKRARDQALRDWEARVDRS